MNPNHRSPARSLVLLVAFLLAVVGATPAVAQTAATDPATPLSESVGNVIYGGVVAAAEKRDPEGKPSLRFGSTIDGLTLQGVRAAFAPGESVAFRLEHPDPIGVTALLAHLIAIDGDTESIVGSGDWNTDPSWDTMTGLLTAPDPGDYALRVFRGGALVAQALLAVRNVPRLSGQVTDPFSFLSDSSDQVDAALTQFEDATDGWLWVLFIDTTSGATIADYAADVWAVNADQVRSTDALLVAAADDPDVSIQVGADLGFHVLPVEIRPLEDDVWSTLADGRWADAVDVASAGLISAEQAPPPNPHATPTPRPTATPRPTPSTVLTPDFVGMTRRAARTLADSTGLVLRVTLLATNEAAPGIVVSQDPAPGRRVTHGATISIVVATQTGTVAVPDVTGQTEADAISTLFDAGLTPGIRSTQLSNAVPAGRVIRTDPRAGIVVARDSTVDYVVSRGPQVTATPTPTPRPTTIIGITVPTLRGMTEDDAVAALIDARLLPGVRSERNSSQIAAGLVIRSSPAAGTQVPVGTLVDYVVSLGPTGNIKPTPVPSPPNASPKPGRTPRPTATPEPTALPTPSGDDLYARVLAAGVLRVNVDPNDPPWSSVAADGTPEGFDIDVATQIATRLGVGVEFTTYPLQEVVIGGWNGRFDISLGHLVITDARRHVLDFTQPYAYDPAQMTATVASGITSLDELAGRGVCVAGLSNAAAWLAGSLDVTSQPIAPLSPPNGASAAIVPTDQTCLDVIGGGSGSFDGWLSSIVSVDAALDAGAQVVPVGVPVFYQPIAVAFDRSDIDDGSLLAAVDGILGDLHFDGSLTTMSVTAIGRDLSMVIGGAPPAAPGPGGGPSFGVDTDLVNQFPLEIGKSPVVVQGLSGADLAALLVPANPDLQRAFSGFVDGLLSPGRSLDQLAFAFGSVVDGSGRSSSVVAARYPGIAPADLGRMLVPVFSAQFGDPVSVDAQVSGKAITRISDGPFTRGDPSVSLYESGDVLWAVSATPPLLGQTFQALP